MATKYNISIIGAGPIGCLLADKLVKKNMDVTVFEEHKKIGEPNHCAGLVSSKKITEIYNFSSNIILNKIRGAIIHFGNDNFKLFRNRDEAVVLDREAFDKNIAENAIKNGAKILLNKKVLGFKSKGSSLKIHLKDSNEHSETKLLVNAAGFKGLISSKLNHHSNYKEFKPALQYDIHNVEGIDKEFVELYFDNNLTPGFFSWIIPINKKDVRVGIASSKGNLKFRLDYFIKKTFFNRERFKKSKIIKIRPGIVITGGQVTTFHNNNLILVGDAAAQVKPTTGGGLITGGLCANIVSNVIDNYFKSDFKNEILYEYKRQFQNILGKEFNYMNYARKILDNLPNNNLIKLFKIIKEEDTLSKFLTLGDMDFQGQIISSFILNKKIINIMPLALISILKNFLK